MTRMPKVGEYYKYDTFILKVLGNQADFIKVKIVENSENPSTTKIGDIVGIHAGIVKEWQYVPYGTPLYDALQGE